MTTDYLIDRREVERRVGLTRSTIYDGMNKGTFPKPLKVGAKAVRWRSSDIGRLDGLPPVDDRRSRLSREGEMTTAREIAAHYSVTGNREKGTYRIKCPAHKGDDPNLTVSDGKEGGLLVYCHSHQCTVKEIFQAFKADGLDIEREWKYPNGKVVRRIDWANRAKKDLSKSDNQSTMGVPILITDTGPDSLIVLTEGESDYDALLAANLPDASPACWVGGWSQAGKADYGVVKGRQVAIWPDHDEHGAKALEAATAACWKVGATGVLAVPYVGAAGSGMGAADLTPDAVAYFLRRLGQEEDDGQPEDAGFTFYDAADWIKDVGPIEWLVEGWFPKQSKILLSAGSKIGKSWLVTALMKASCEGWTA